jgi:hypothetical protein
MGPPRGRSADVAHRFAKARKEEADLGHVSADAPGMALTREELNGLSTPYGPSTQPKFILIG